MAIKILCTIWKDVKIYEKKEMMFLKGNDIARIDGAELKKILSDKWRYNKAVFANWKSFQRLSNNNNDLTKIEVLNWLNVHTYSKLHNELKILEVNDEEGKKQEKEALDLEKDYGAKYHDERVVIRVHERQIIRNAINELETWFTKQGKDIPYWQPFSEITDPIYKELEKSKDEIERLKWELLKKDALNEFLKKESKKVKIAPIKYKSKHFKEVDKLRKKYKVSEALKQIADKYVFSYEGFKQQYYTRWLVSKKVKRS